MKRIKIAVWSACLMAAIPVAPASAEGFRAFCEQRTAAIHPEVTPEAGCSCLAKSIEANPALEAELGPDSPARETQTGAEAAGVLSSEAVTALKACGYHV